MAARGSLIAAGLLVIMAGCTAVVLAGRPDEADLRDPLVTQAFRPIGVGDPDWRTVVLRAVRDVPLPADRVWDSWERIQDWSKWGGPLIVESRWIDIPGWREGARFEQVMDLGFPLRRFSSIETVGHVEPRRKVSWWKDQGAFRIHQMWSVEPTAAGARLEFITVLQGPVAGLARAVIEDSWRRRIEQAADGLVAAAQQSAASPARR